MKKSLLFFLTLAITQLLFAQTIHYVKAGGTGDGISWSNASGDLQAMLNAAQSGDQIWVAAGTYQPSTTNDPTSSFVLKNGVAIYGGFSGTETSLSDRNWQTNVTILSGNNNSYHVVRGNSGTDNTAVLNGFTITGGFADNGVNQDDLEGGGMYNDNSSPTLTNCTFSGNSAFQGGGMYNDNSSSPRLTNCTFSGNSGFGGGCGMYNNSSAPILTNCTFSGNISAAYGGGMYNHSSSPTLTNCAFSGNSTDEGAGMYNESSSAPTLTNCTFSGNMANYGTGGCGMYNTYSSPTLVNCTFSGNNAAQHGGGMTNDNSSPTLTHCVFLENSADDGAGMYNGDFSSPRLTNCTFSGNSASYGGGMFNDNSSPTLTNCILWGDPGEEEIAGSPIVTYSIVQGGYSGAGNKDQSPLFVDSANGNLHLQGCSPAIDAGNDAANSTTTDLDGNPRKVRTIDMGAYEYQGALATATIADAKALNKGVDVNTVYIGYTPASSLILQAGISGASGPFTYQWSTGATTPSITVSPTTTTTYTVTVSSGTCTAMASKQVKVVDVRCGNPNNKVSMCHGGNTLCIDKTSVQDHLNIGDYLGSCKTSGKNLTAASEQAATPLSIQATPNPSRSYFSLMIHSNNVKDRVTLRVIDAVGRTVEVKTVSAGETVHIGASYMQGTYFVQAVQGSSSVTVKLIKQ